MQFEVLTVSCCGMCHSTKGKWQSLTRNASKPAAPEINPQRRTAIVCHHSRLNDYVLSTPFIRQPRDSMYVRDERTKIIASVQSSLCGGAVSCSLKHYFCLTDPFMHSVSRRMRSGSSESGVETARRDQNCTG